MKLRNRNVLNKVAVVVEVEDNMEEKKKQKPRSKATKRIPAVPKKEPHHHPDSSKGRLQLKNLRDPCPSGKIVNVLNDKRRCVKETGKLGQAVLEYIQMMSSEMSSHNWRSSDFTTPPLMSDTQYQHIMQDFNQGVLHSDDTVLVMSPMLKDPTHRVYLPILRRINELAWKYTPQMLENAESAVDNLMMILEGIVTYGRGNTLLYDLILNRGDMAATGLKQTEFFLGIVSDEKSKSFPVTDRLKRIRKRMLQLIHKTPYIGGLLHAITRFMILLFVIYTVYAITKDGKGMTIKWLEIENELKLHITELVGMYMVKGSKLFTELADIYAHLYDDSIWFHLYRLLLQLCNIGGGLAAIPINLTGTILKTVAQF